MITNRQLVMLVRGRRCGEQPVRDHIISSLPHTVNARPDQSGEIRTCPKIRIVPKTHDILIRVEWVPGQVIRQDYQWNRAKR